LTELEQRLSSFFHEEAERASLPGAMYHRVLRRAKIRRGVTAAMAGLAVIAVSMATVMAARAFQSSSPIGPANPVPSPTSSSTHRDTGDGVHVTRPKVKVAEGTVAGKSWALIAYESNAGLCVDLQMSSGSGGGCGLDVPDKGDLGLNLGSQVGLPKTIIHGIVSRRVSTLQVRLDDGETRNVEIVEGPERFEVDFFAAFLPRNVTGVLEAKDHEDAVLQKERLGADSPDSRNRRCDFVRVRPTYLPGLKPGEPIPAPTKSYDEVIDRPQLSWEIPGFAPEEAGVGLTRYPLPGGTGEGRAVDAEISGVGGQLHAQDESPNTVGISWDLGERCNFVELTLVLPGVTQVERVQEVTKIAESLQETDP
jgi:hypothetical protein